MKKIFPRLLILTFAYLLGGCAYTTQTTRLTPEVIVAPSDRGNGFTVSVSVADERANRSLGHRGDAYGRGAEIRTDDDVAMVVKNEIVKGLQSKGFKVSGENPGASLSIEVRLLEYSTSTGLFTGGVHINAALKANANRGGANYSKLYRSDKEERVSFVPSASTNEAWINQGLANAIQQILADDELLKFLATKG